MNDLRCPGVFLFLLLLLPPTDLLSLRDDFLFAIRSTVSASVVSRHTFTPLDFISAFP